MSKLTIKITNYQDEIEAIKNIRTCVFQEEQGVDPVLEFDGYDDNCVHFIAYINEEAIGTTRVRYLDKNTAKIERLAVLASSRGQGVGTALMKEAITFIKGQEKYQKIVIHAQVYIQILYEKLGFEPIGDRFTEADIIHIKMIKYI
ncbi:GNAT family N-acetyltransferase [Crocosphaera sp.]|uniref:GNAT family N-acetyltransferase n=1 Tax=Crocosphaera sp. TaxID=2729996 RepID=UPI002638790A|nr:GNAT family N-acetyltransferase [Crocosphaera sp.]MDJ0580073.1 GNAT family N-acetyltransferase [Crocosphaera sp.]